MPSLGRPSRRFVAAILVGFVSLSHTACGRRDPVPAAQAAPPAAAQPLRNPAPKDDAPDAKPAPPKTPPTDAQPPRPKPRRTLADLVPEPQRDGGPAAAKQPPKRAALDPARAAAAGLRKVASKHLTLYTDLPEQPAVDEIPRVFDLAVPEWCAYFELPLKRLADWHLTGYVMRDADRFRRIDALPGDLPPFPNGFQRGDEFWVHEQDSDYYRRHLVLHEGTHAFMDSFLSGMGPPWYAEGMAELLGTHRWRDGALTLGYMPRDRDEVPMWGRVKIIRDEFAAGEGKPLEVIFAYDARAALDVSHYGWCWGAATFLDHHPRFQTAFRAARRDANENGPEFSRRLMHRLESQWPDVREEWQLFVADVDYGYDFARAAVLRKPGAALPADGATVKISAERGWQSTGIRLDAGQTYRVRARGKYQIAADPDVWWCEPGGVTIRYHLHEPAGMVIAAIRPDELPPSEITPLARPTPIGLERLVEVNRTGTLYVRINEPSSELADNKGEFLVRVQRHTE